MIQPNREEKMIVINKEYRLTQKQIKAFFKIEGDIISMGLAKGLSPNDVEKGVSMDTQEFYITVIEKKRV